MRVFSFPIGFTVRVFLLFPLLIGAFLLLLPAPPAAAQDVPPPAAGASGTWDEVPIQVGDVLELRVWRHEDFSGEFPVDARGRAALPLVGEWEVAGELPSALRDRLSQAYARTLRDPVVALEVLRRVRVLGEVNQPGVFHLDGTMTVADALAMAGGRTPLAREGEVLLRRGEEVIEADVRADARLSELPIRSGDELLVLHRSWVDRNSAALISATAGLLGILLALTLR